MFKRSQKRDTKAAHAQRGTILIETLVAAALLLMVASGLTNAFLVVIAQNQEQGNMASRCTEYAQDEMESLVPLSFSSAGLGGTMAASATVGSIPPAAATTGYVTYLDGSGTVVTSATAVYTRQWQISTDSTGTLKTITVVVTGKTINGFHGLAPSTTLVSVVSSGI